MAKKPIIGTKTYILTLTNGGERHVTVPATWQLTFGQLVPYAAKKAYEDAGPAALRFYEGTKDNLRAVMIDVVGIRDSSAIVAEFTEEEVKSRKANLANTAKEAKYYDTLTEDVPVQVIPMKRMP